MLTRKNGHLIVTEETRIVAVLMDSDMIAVRGYAVVEVENASDIDSYVQSVYNDARDYVNNFLLPGDYYLMFEDACIDVYTIRKETVENKTKKISFRVSNSQFESLRLAAKERGVSLSKLFYDYACQVCAKAQRENGNGRNQGTFDNKLYHGAVFTR